MKKLYVLFDCPELDNDKKWLVYGLNAKGYDVESLYVPQRLSQLIRNKHLFTNYLLQIVQVFKVLKKSQKDDIIICWYSVTGVILNLLSRMFANRRLLILMNWLTPPAKTSLTTFMYKFAISNNKCTILVNSMESADQWQRLLSIDTVSYAHFIFNPDVYDSEVSFVNPLEKLKSVDGGYFFTGGMSNRNWALLADVARKMDKVHFVCCALQQDFESQVTNKPSNMKVYYNVSSDEYYSLLAGSYAVLIPLKSKSVAGLINILRSIQEGVICCISETPATKQYYADETLQFVVEDSVESWLKCVMNLLTIESDEYAKIITGMQDFIFNEFSPDSACDRLSEIVNQCRLFSES